MAPRLIKDIRLFLPSEPRAELVEIWNEFRKSGIEPNHVPTRFGLKLRETGVTTSCWSYLDICLEYDLEDGELRLPENRTGGIFIHRGTNVSEMALIHSAQRDSITLSIILEVLEKLAHEFDIDMSGVQKVRRSVEHFGNDLEIVVKRKRLKNLEIVLSITVDDSSRLFLFVKDHVSDRWGRKEIVALQHATDAYALCSRMSVVGDEIRVFAGKSDSARFTKDHYFTELYFETEYLRVNLNDLWSEGDCPTLAWQYPSEG